MRISKSFAACIFGLGLAFASTVALAQQDQSSTGDPVADAARKTREQKKTAPKPKKVFTDDDIAPRPSPDVAPAADTSASPDKAEAVASQAANPALTNQPQEKKEDPNSEAGWRKRFAAQRKKISDAEEALSVLEREAEKADLQYYSDPQKTLHEQYSRQEINEKNEKMAAKKKEIADLKQQLSDMEDQLRASGGDPGWAR